MIAVRCFNCPDGWLMFEVDPRESITACDVCEVSFVVGEPEPIIEETLLKRSARFGS